MSWFNFNDSFTNIKEQISSIANEVLANAQGESTPEDDEISKSSQEVLQINHGAREPNQIGDNALVQDKNADTSWSWDPPDSNAHQQQTTAKNLNLIEELKRKIDTLENEKKDLYESLEQLDADCQRTTDKLIALKDTLQTEHNELKLQFADLKKSHDHLLQNDGKLRKNLDKLQIDNKKLVEELQKFKSSDKNSDRNLDNSENIELKKRIEELSKNQNDQIQKIDELSKKNSEKSLKIDELSKENSEKSLKIDELSKENSEKSLKIEELISNNNKLDNKETKFQELSAKIEVLKNENEGFRRDVQNEKLINANLKKENAALTMENNDLKIKLSELDKEKMSDIKQLMENTNLNGYNEENVNLMKQNIELLDKLINFHCLVKNNEDSFNEIKANNLELARVNSDLHTKLVTLENEKESMHRYYEETINDLKNQLNFDGTSARDTYRNCITIIQENLMKFIDFNLQLEDSDDSNIVFTSVVETVIKLILDFKWKTEMLEKEVVELTQEKTKILTEKNCEIEKLLANSEVLSQEVIMKTQTLKEYEKEVSELEKNNDLLIEELESYKNSGLQTISETNEDNLLLLESQLESANKKIKELELTLGDLENNKQDANVEMQTELDYIKQQLNITGTELSQCKEQKKELITTIKNLEEQKNKTEKLLENLQEEHKNCKTSSQELSTNLEKVKTELEISEYKCTELNVAIEELKDELEAVKNNERSNKQADDDIMSLRNLLNNSEQQVEKQQKEVAALTAKIQEIKVNETTLKVHLENLRDAKISADLLIENQKKEIKDLLEKHENDVATLEQAVMENQKLDEELAKLQQELMIKSQEIDKIKTNTNFGEENQVKLKEEINKLQTEIVDLKTSNESDKKLEEYQLKISKLQTEIKDLKENKQLKEYQLEISKLQKEIKDLNDKAPESNELMMKMSALQAELMQIHTSRNELIGLLNAKQNENVAYYQEIQRLSQCLSNEITQKSKIQEELIQAKTSGASDELTMKLAEVEKQFETAKRELEGVKTQLENTSEQNAFLRQKCEVLAENLLQEQANVQKVLSERSNTSEVETSLRKELERLRIHMVEVEETYTQELIEARNKNEEMQVKVNEMEQREKNSNNMYTSINIRANQQVETLQNQLQLVTNQREELRKKISDYEDQMSKQGAALANLQFVLEQFQKDKDNQVYKETERIRRQISDEKQVQENLKKEIATLRQQLEESNQGLQAASRLSDQLEISKQQLVNFKEEVTTLQNQLKKLSDENKSLTTQTDTKVDKTLVKNLVVGFITSNNNLNKDQQQILKIISTVLDFNKQDNEKINLNKQNGSWINSLLHPQSPGQNMSQESLSQAFVRFLENESKPMALPNLLETGTAPTSATTATTNAGDQPSSSSSSNGTKNAPILLSQVVLPTFSDFAQNRNSSSILKDVLNDHS